MFTVFLIAVALLQFSVGQTVEHEHEITRELDTTTISNDSIDEDLIQYKLAKLIDDNRTEWEYIFETDDDFLRKENIEDKEDMTEPVITFPDGDLVNEQGKKTLPTSYGGEDSCSSETLNEEIASEECLDTNKDVINTTITLSTPVKSEGKVTIIVQLGSEGNSNDDDSNLNNGDEPFIDKPISFNGCAKGEGKVSVATHYGRADSRNTETAHETVAAVLDEEPDGSVSFGGPVHAQGKVSVGTHYGCGGPIGMSPMYLPMPRFSTYYPQFYNHPLHSYPGSFLAQHPLSMPEKGPVTSPGIPENHLGNHFADSRECLPVGLGSGNVDDNMSFDGIVPVSGTVSIAARF